MENITINDLVEGKGPIWVINTSNELYPSGADVYVTFTSAGGQPSIMTVPRTWLPTELTARFTRKVILDSPYFTDALSKNMLKVISPEAAAVLLQSKGADRETRRLKEIQEAIKAANTVRGVGKNVMITTGDMDLDKEMEDRSVAERPKTEITKVNAGGVDLGSEEDEVADEVSPNFKAWVLKVNEMEDEDDARNEVRMRGKMDISEAEYLMRNLKHEGIASSLATRLKKLATAS